MAEFFLINVTVARLNESFYGGGDRSDTKATFGKKTGSLFFRKLQVPHVLKQQPLISFIQPPPKLIRVVFAVLEFFPHVMLSVGRKLPVRFWPYYGAHIFIEFPAHK